jgi:hypothetical protein
MPIIGSAGATVAPASVLPPNRAQRDRVAGGDLLRRLRRAYEGDVDREEHHRDPDDQDQVREEGEDGTPFDHQ